MVRLPPRAAHYPTERDAPSAEVSRSGQGLTRNQTSANPGITSTKPEMSIHRRTFIVWPPRASVLVMVWVG